MSTQERITKAKRDFFASLESIERGKKQNIVHRTGLVVTRTKPKVLPMPDHRSDLIGQANNPLAVHSEIRFD